MYFLQSRAAYRVHSRLAAARLMLLLALAGCARDKGRLHPAGNYPPEIGRIIVSRCATAGCHNAQSREAAGGLSLASWTELFSGSDNGAVVIPFRPDFSSLCLFTNVDPSRGPALSPTMPLNQAALSEAEYSALASWIRDGARDANGNTAFAAQRRKLYVSNMLCDAVTVVDAATRLPARYIDVGVRPGQEFPACVRASATAQLWCVSFFASPVLQVFDAATDTPLGVVDLGPGVWSSFMLTADGRQAVCVDKSDPGSIAWVDLRTLRVVGSITHPLLAYPTGVASSPNGKKLYVSMESGNYLTVIDSSGGSMTVTPLLLSGSAPSTATSDDPACISAKDDLCYAGCRGSRRLVIISMTTDSVIGACSLDAPPTGVTVMPDNDVAAISRDDTTSFAGLIGSISVVKATAWTVSKKFYPGCQPMAAIADAESGWVTVVNSNVTTRGPAPHHQTGCAGRNGYLSFFRSGSWTASPRRYEVGVFPSSGDAK